MSSVKSTAATKVSREKVLSSTDVGAVVATDEVANWDDFATVLDKMNEAYKQARFDDKLRAQAVALNSFVRNQEPQETREFYKGLGLIYELNDMFPNKDPNEGANIDNRAHDFGEVVYKDLRQLSIRSEALNQISDEERLLARDKVMFCACRGNELRRRGRPEDAAKLFEWLLNFTATTLRTRSLPCFGTEARLTYHLGCVYRVLERQNRAEEMFTRTLNLLYQRAKMRKVRHDDSRAKVRKVRHDDSDRLSLIRKQAMAIGIGYGWVNLTKGSLAKAENALTTARSLLAGINDPVIPSFIELLYGSIKRCRAGTNREALEKAVESLEAARDSFHDNGHWRHVPRACWELSLAQNLLGDFDKAEENLRTVEEYAIKVRHAKWETNVLILRSRLLRNRKSPDASTASHQLNEALAHADAAVDKAEECKSILPLTDAYITRGEAKFEIIEASDNPASSYEAARKDFERALEGLEKSSFREPNETLPLNPKIAAVCELRIAQCFVRDGEESKARGHFNKWELLRPSVEHAWVRELGNVVSQEIETTVKNFTISAKTPREWNYARNLAQLRSWLLTQSLRYTKRNYSAAADLIGVKRGTLYQWQDDSRAQTQRARTKNRE